MSEIALYDPPPQASHVASVAQSTSDPNRVSPTVRECSRCGARLPATEEFFGYKDGRFLKICRECVAERREEQRQAKDADVNRSLNRAVTGLLNRIKSEKGPMDALAGHIEGIAQEMQDRLPKKDRRRAPTAQETVARIVGRALIDTIEDPEESNFAKLKAVAEYDNLLGLAVRRSPEAPMDFSDATDEEVRAALMPAAQELLQNDDDFLIQLVLSRGPEFLKRLMKESGTEILDIVTEEAEIQAALEEAIGTALGV